MLDGAKFIYCADAGLGSYNLNSAKNYNEANDFRLNLP